MTSRRRRRGIAGALGTLPPIAALADFFYDINFVAGTTKNGTQPYGSNTNDGRFFRDPSNVVATFCPPNPDGTGTLVSVSSQGLRRTTAGVWSYPSLTNRALWNRDMTNVVWVPTTMTVAKNQTGADGAANAASSLTAAGANSTLLQTITLASGQVVYSVDIKRLVGTGNIDLTVDGGTTWSTVTITGSYTQQFITQAAVTNPVIGIRIVTSGDAVAVDFHHLITPTNSMNVPKQERVATTTTTVLNSQSRPNVDQADAGPLWGVTAGAFSFYWQGRSLRPTGAFIMTSSAGYQLSVMSTGSGGAVQFASGAVSTTADLTWRSTMAQVNKVAGYISPTGVIKVAANGVLGSTGAGATLNPGMSHWDAFTNGAGANSGYGVNERFAFSRNRIITDAALVALTT